MTLSDLGHIWTRYLELTGDMEFAAASGLFIFGLVIFLVLLGKLAKAPKEPSALDIAAAAIETAPTPAAPSAPAPAAPPGAAMMGTGFDAKPIPPMTPRPPSSQILVPQPIPPKSVLDMAATTKLDATPPMEKTMVLPSSDLPNIKPQPPIDVGMYEALVRRISTVEAEIKKDPLYLDPLVKRVGGLEKKAEDLAVLAARLDSLEKKVAETPAAAPGAPAAEAAPLPPDLLRQNDLAPMQSQLADMAQRLEQLASASPQAAAATESPITQEEFVALKEKVTGLQKILELLAEGTNPPQ